MFSRKAVSVLALAALVTFAGSARASAASIYYFTDDGVIGGIGADAAVPGYGSVTLTQNGLNTVKVTVSLASLENFTDNGNGHVAFAFNLVNAPLLTAAANVTGVTTGFQFLSPGGLNVKNSPFGNFNYGFSCTTCQGGDGPVGPLTFTLTLAGLTEDSFKAKSTEGYYFAADIYRAARPGDSDTGAIGVPGSQLPTNSNQITAIPTPEPASLLLLGTGLTVAARRFRKNRR